MIYLCHMKKKKRLEELWKEANLIEINLKIVILIERSQKREKTKQNMIPFAESS